MAKCKFSRCNEMGSPALAGYCSTECWGSGVYLRHNGMRDLLNYIMNLEKRISELEAEDDKVEASKQRTCDDCAHMNESVGGCSAPWGSCIDYSNFKPRQQSDKEPRVVTAQSLIDDGMLHEYEVTELLKQEGRKRPESVVSTTGHGWAEAGLLPEFYYPLELLGFRLGEGEEIPTLDRPVVNWEWMSKWTKAVAMDAAGNWYGHAVIPRPNDFYADWPGEHYFFIPEEYAPHWQGDWKESLCVRPGIEEGE